MTKDNEKWVEQMVEKYALGKGYHVLDVGSYNVNGEVRQFFDKDHFVGIDMRDGPGVDKVIRGNEIKLHWNESTFDTVVCLNTLEHDDRFWETLEQMKTVLRPGGYMAIITPTINFPIHDHPADYFRFTEQAYRDILFEGFEVLELEHQYTKTDDNGNGINPVICCIGKKL